MSDASPQKTKPPEWAMQSAIDILHPFSWTWKVHVARALADLRERTLDESIRAVSNAGHGLKDQILVGMLMRAIENLKGRAPGADYQ